MIIAAKVDKTKMNIGTTNFSNWATETRMRQFELKQSYVFISKLLTKVGILQTFLDFKKHQVIEAQTLLLDVHH